MNISEQLHSRFATKSELAELEKALSAQTAIQPDPAATPARTTGSAEAMVTVDYDADLQKKVFHQSPFLTYLEQAGCVSDANSAKVGYRVKEQKTTSSFIAETGAIPAHDPSVYKDEIAKMQTIVYPIEISDLALAGVDAVDLLEDEIRDGFLDMAQTKDKAVLQGTSSANGFDGVLESIDTHKENMQGAEITKDAIDELAQDIIDDGGNPTAILTTASVGRQLNDILYPSVRTIDQVDLTLGTRVTAYHAPNGQTIPIIVDPNIDRTNTTIGGSSSTPKDALAFVDANTLRLRELVKPAIAELAKTKLSVSRVLFSYFTFYNRAEYRNGMIYNIGEQ